MKNTYDKMHLSLGRIIVVFLLMASIGYCDGVYQYSVPIYNSANNAYLWIPPNCRQVRGIVLLDQNGLEELFGVDPVIRQACTDANLAIVWFIGKSFPNFQYKSGADKVMLRALEDLAWVSGYSEIKYAPLLPMGHSASSPFCWYVGFWKPDRTIAIISLKGASFATPPSFDPTANLHGVPSIQVSPEYYEWPSAALDRRAHWKSCRDIHLSFKAGNVQNLFGFMLEVAHGHFDWTAECAPVMAMFIRKAAQYRLPATAPLDGPVTLNTIVPSSGYLLDPAMNHSAPVAYNSHPDPLHAFWYFDQEMAQTITNFGMDQVGKKDELISVVQSGQLLDIGQLGYASTAFIPEDIDNNMQFTYTGDYLTQMPPQLINQGVLTGHANAPITYLRITGPLMQVSPLMFRIKPHRAHYTFPRETWVLAYSDGDANYRRTMQPLAVTIPANTTGLTQTITFPKIEDQIAGTKSIKLNATSTSGLAVEYWVKYGPAEVEGDTLSFTQIPPRSRMPIKVSVVAYQWGRYKIPKYQTATSVERTFFIWGCPNQ